jgi:MFS transporter, Spinster family, sphingosine-1-phosphate transporter
MSPSSRERMIVRSYRNYLLAVLVVVQVFNTSDSVALGLVLQNIKLDLSLTDTELGLLTGVAFALMYSVVGIAIARWADRGDRVTILALTALLWSILVAACGMAVSFVQLFLLRAGVGIGEAGCHPTSQSLIADYFNRAERPRATGIYIMAAGLTYVVGYGVAGWLSELYGWRVMFAALGLPGVALAAIVWLTLREPRFESPLSFGATGWFRARRRTLAIKGARVSRPRPPGLKEVAITLWSTATLRHLVLFWSVCSVCVTGFWQWVPAFLMRTYALNIGGLGTALALAAGIGSTVGPLLGGAWASRYAANNERLQLRTAALATCAVMIFWILLCLISNRYFAFALLGLYAAALTAFTGLFWATIQTLVPENMRASAVAIIAFLQCSIGGVLGPFATGALSDAMEVKLGMESLRYSLVSLSGGLLWAGYHMWRASQSVTRDLAATRGERGASGAGVCTLRA